MAKFKFKAVVTADDIISAKIDDASVTDADVGKAVRLDIGKDSSYTLCADGDSIDGFITGIDPATADGKLFASIQVGGRKRCESEGTMTIGDLVEAGTVAAAGTAEANLLPTISTHAMDDTTATSLLADMFQIQWRVISADTADGDIADEDTTVIIERL